MELIRISAINGTWKLCTVAAFLILFLLTLFITNNSPQTFIISTSRSTEPPASQPSFSNISDAIILQSFNPPDLEDKLFSSSLSPPYSSSADYQIPAAQPNSTPAADLSQPEKLISSSDNTTSTAREYELPPDEANSSPETAPGPGDGGVGERKCKMYEGKWVYKPTENPRYHVSQCNFLEEKMSCRRNGRPDSDYEGWGWESDGCHLPLFNGTDMLEKMKRKRMIIVGDSLNRNMWESLTCLLYTSIAPRRAYVDAGNPEYKVFKAKDYKFTLEFYWAPFLVHLDENHKSGKTVLTLDKMVPSSTRWRGADVMVFNSGHWWTHHGKLKVWDMFEYSGEQVEQMQTELAYERGLSSWAQWLAQNVDPLKTKVYFRSISPEHSGKQWCFNHTRPMSDEVDGPYRQFYPRSMIDVAEQKMREMNGEGEVVRYLNITGMSSYRIDAHPSIYRFKHWKVIMEKYKRFLKSRSDCSHWCLPGLPDTWNRVLYGSLFFDHLIPGDLSGS